MAAAAYHRIAGKPGASGPAASGTADAQYKFQTDEALARKTFSDKLAQAERSRITGVTTPALPGLAQIAKNAADSTASWQASVDAAFAAAERTYWTAETSHENHHRKDATQADVLWWSAQENAHVIVAQLLDGTTEPVLADPTTDPWTASLVAQAYAHQAWWGSASYHSTTGIPSGAGQALEYLEWVVDRNTQEANWQAAINGTFSPLTGHTQLSERQKLRPVQEWRRESDPSRRPGVGRKADAIAHRNAAPTDCHETR